MEFRREKGFLDGGSATPFAAAAAIFLGRRRQAGGQGKGSGVAARRRGHDAGGGGSGADDAIQTHGRTTRRSRRQWLTDGFWWGEGKRKRMCNAS